MTHRPCYTLLLWLVGLIFIIPTATQTDELAPGDDPPDPWPNIVWCLNDKDCVQFGDTNAKCTELYECECGSSSFAYPDDQTKECHPVGTPTDTPVQTTFLIRWADADCDQLTDEIKEYMIDVLEQHFGTNVRVQFVCGSVSIAGSVVVPLEEVSTKLSTLEQEVVQATETDDAARGVLLGTPSVSSGRATTTHCEIEYAVTTTYSDVTGKCYVVACDYGYEPSYAADMCVEQPINNPTRGSSNDIGVQASWIIGLAGAVVFFLLIACVFLNYRRVHKYDKQNLSSQHNSSSLDSSGSISSSNIQSQQTYNDDIVQMNTTAASSSDGFSEIYVT